MLGDDLERVSQCYDKREFLTDTDDAGNVLLKNFVLLVATSSDYHLN